MTVELDIVQERAPVWRQKFCEGTKLVDALNDMEAEGYSVMRIIHFGAKAIDNPIAGTKMIIPMFVVLGRDMAYLGPTIPDA